ncbi:atypical chemokine receptor 2-like [Salminus brasiliensis]|uniref:atypical chemokine receptor 2-like n=1 Tax=Salminus brasiliensis TaxID=930266 RepID=UPI003B82E6AB
MQRDNCSNGSQFSEALPIYKASSAVLGLCFVLGVPGNIVVLGMLVRRVKENSFTTCLLLSLAVSDLLSLLPLPVWIWAYLHGWIFGSAACRIISYIEYWCLYCSALCVTLMSIQRYMQVLHPQKWAKLGDRGRKGLLAGIWILSGLLGLHAPAKRRVGCKPNGLQDCGQQFRNDEERVAILLLEILLFVICCSLLVFFYCRLHRGVNQSPFFSSSRMTKLVTRIVVVFFIVCVLVPIANMLIIIMVFHNNLTSLTVPANHLLKISRALTFLNSCVNPFLYTFSFSELRCPCAATEDTNRSD